MKYLSLIIVLGVLISGLWAFFVEPYLLEIKRLKLKNEDLAGLKIVFASDFHIKPYEKLRLKKIIRKINEQNPDIILLGGDFVNSHKKNMTYPIEKISSELKSLKSNYGTYAILGNHDGWQGKYEVIQALQENNITVLENSNINLNNFTIAGVEDLQTGNPNIEKAIGQNNKNVILLTHSPDIFPQVPDTVFLTLAGHTHGGQIVFWGMEPLLVPSVYGKKYAYGLKQKNGKTMYVSKGLGTSILPLRFNCKPEIVVIEFEK